MNESELKDHVRDCCDKCCEVYPKITVCGYIKIICSNCGKSAEGKDVFKVIQNWNKEVRKK